MRQITIPPPARRVLLMILLSALLTLPAWASGYHGRVHESAIPGRYTAEVRDQYNKIVWSDTRTFANRERAQRRADRKAEKLNKGEEFLPTCREDPNMPHCNPGY